MSYQLITHPQFTILVAEQEVKDNGTCWVYNLKTNILIKETGKSGLIANDRKIIGSINPEHGVPLLLPGNISYRRKERQERYLFDLAVKFGYGSYLDSKELKRLVDFYKYTQTVNSAEEDKEKKWTDDDMRGMYKQGASNGIQKNLGKELDFETEYQKTVLYLQQPQHYEAEIETTCLQCEKMTDIHPHIIVPKLTTVDEKEYIIITKLT